MPPKGYRKTHCLRGHARNSSGACKACQVAYRKAYNTTPEARAYYKVYNARPEQRAYRKARYATDSQFKLTRNLRSRLHLAIKGKFKAGSAIRDLGCSIPELIEYFKPLFQEGMSWENHGEWHIDHIIPLSAFDLTDPEQLKVACHFTNLQPLWAVENIRKGGDKR